MIITTLLSHEMWAIFRDDGRAPLGTCASLELPPQCHSCSSRGLLAVRRIPPEVRREWDDLGSNLSCGGEPKVMSSLIAAARQHKRWLPCDEMPLAPQTWHDRSLLPGKLIAVRPRMQRLEDAIMVTHGCPLPSPPARPQQLHNATSPCCAGQPLLARHTGETVRLPAELVSYRHGTLFGCRSAARGELGVCLAVKTSDPLDGRRSEALFARGGGRIVGLFSTDGLDFADGGVDVVLSSATMSAGGSTAGDGAWRLARAMRNVARNAAGPLPLPGSNYSRFLLLGGLGEFTIAAPASWVGRQAERSTGHTPRAAW